jgi:hypothetical protein
VSTSDPLNLVSATKSFVASLEGSGQVVIGVGLVAVGVALAVSGTSVGRAAIASSGRLGKTALQTIPQTRAVASILLK